MILCLRYISAINCTALTVPGEYRATVLLSASTSFPPKDQMTLITLLLVSPVMPRHIPYPVSFGGRWSFLQTSINSSHVLGGSALAAARISRRVTSGEGLIDWGMA